ncbi:alpha-N-arabinofuranosidase [Streptosporangium becharense]|uniref:non-reducing end alpha-L-arabinofuranosidase n=1 Tax=Streptosporangium becharense TaxID=1816182 RepID=A0A7W9MFK4_9ACTN|nr:alpha-N-arabinofuranosidase [Streptosporangium becharense]MBB2912029.1 alpha-N-arabinofuranosidase [Streptosporangium becharense]MBB5818576.1 alpha-N-arabinofuranosidase [Streptosporangium becharense]
MATTARLTLDPAFRIGPVEPRLFGSFVEHMGRCVYTGVFEPGHPAADADGLRTDVLELTRELGVTLVRYPGGNFVSNYRWEDGVGPVENRPARLDLAWRSLEDNRFGLNEFMVWAAKAGVEPMMALNLGTRGVAEALELVEYANYPGGTRLSDLRRAHGFDRPHDVRLWCLGNELDGPWQMGHKTAAEYGRLAAETARALKRFDPGLSLVACGSSNSAMPTFGAWEAEVLEATYEMVDHVSLHAYYDPSDGDVDSFLASGADMDHMIRSIAATADHVGARLRSRKKIKLSFDEWNVWYQSRFPGEAALDWTERPRLIEDAYDVTDAVVVGSLLITLLRNADRVGVACQAQLANVIAPIRTEPGGPAWRQSIFHPFALTARHARGQVLRVEPECATIATAKHGDVPAIWATATYDETTGELALFVVNRDRREPCALEVALPGELRPVEHLELTDDDLSAVNTAETPDRVRPRPGTGLRLRGRRASLTLPPVSWSVIRLAPDSPQE